MGARRALIFVVFSVTAGGVALTARGQQLTEIYKCADASGRPLYTSDKKDTSGKKCELVSREINVVPAQKPPAAATRQQGSAGGPPKESPSTRASARERQREILESELRAEEGLLVEAKKSLAEQEAIRTGDERNYARVEERLQPFKDTIELHEKNIAALRRELGNLYR
jgi:hypothetical protein